LSYVGCTLKDNPDTFSITQKIGIKLSNNVISGIAPDSIASTLLSIGDEILMINGQTPDKTFELNDHVKITLKRKGYETKVDIKSNNETYFKSYNIERSKDATKQEDHNFNLWLNN